MTHTTTIGSESPSPVTLSGHRLQRFAPGWKTSIGASKDEGTIRLSGIEGALSYLLARGATHKLRDAVPTVGRDPKADIELARRLA